MRLIDADALEVVDLQGKSEEFSDGVMWILEQIDKCKLSINDYIAFPHTIGNITFYSREELEEWINHQKLV